MDGDGELQPAEDDLNAGMPCTAGSGERCSGRQDNGAGDDINNDEDEEEEDDDDEEENNANEWGDDDDDGDTTDGVPPQQESTSRLTEPTALKRKHIKSWRMQEYHAMQKRTSQSSGQRRECHVCGHVLYSGPGFRYHIQTHKRDNESFSCDNCKKEFKSLNGLKYHQKRKRCRGSGPTATASSASTTNYDSSSTMSRLPSHLVLREEYSHNSLMEFAKLATGPQSPLLQSPGLDSRGSLTSSFFSDPEASAVMALSSMKKMRSGALRRGLGSASSQHLHSIESQQQQQPHHQQQEKPKRPMNGFMLFAQRNRAELNKKNPDMNNRMISTKLSEEWKKLPEEERQIWIDEAKLKAEQHLKVYPDCWKRKK